MVTRIVAGANEKSTIWTVPGTETGGGADVVAVAVGVAAELVAAGVGELPLLPATVTVPVISGWTSQ